ncbi:hypothetical protein EAO70_09335 [Streptomyces sp. adm13(2018)]|uniref:hypothetical protein n=1 Tax=Streptomyces sp. adm13(2018) TaxID=2479007 RepID=UPI0011CE5707|nr:hypothetical protein [Streptomyces sp. adm13(2018)]TXS20205.1 hypothetical protein EAO70_09335 [Streptomyces sp. adm13(2018)]
MAVRSVQITGTGQLLDLSRRLRHAGGPRLRANLQRRVRRAAEPLHRDMQQTIRNLPIRAEPRKAGSRGGASPTSRPLRATIAAAVRISVRTSSTPGARVWVDRSALPSDLESMPLVMNNPTGRIRHKVFGNRKRWVNQWTTPLWWDKTVAHHTPRMRAEVERVLADVRRDLT